MLNREAPRKSIAPRSVQLFDSVGPFIALLTVFLPHISRARQVHFSLLAGAEISVRNMAKGTPKSEAWLKAVPESLRLLADHIAASPYLCVELKAWPHRGANGKLANGFTVQQKLELFLRHINEGNWSTAWHGEFPSELHCAFNEQEFGESCGRLSIINSDPTNYPLYLAAQEALRDDDPNVDGLAGVRLRVSALVLPGTALAPGLTLDKVAAFSFAA